MSSFCLLHKNCAGHLAPVDFLYSTPASFKPGIRLAIGKLVSEDEVSIWVLGLRRSSSCFTVKRTDLLDGGC